MKSEDTNKIDQLINLPHHLTLEDFRSSVQEYIERKFDKARAIQELDAYIGAAQNHISSLSLLLKQNFLLSKYKNDPALDESELFSKQEIAIKYKVSVRTVNNWIFNGLETQEVGGVIRISLKAIEEYKRKYRSRKFNTRCLV